MRFFDKVSLLIGKKLKEPTLKKDSSERSKPVEASSSAQEKCYLVVTEDAANTAFPIDDLFKGNFDDLYKDKDNNFYQGSVHVDLNKAISASRQHQYGSGTHQDGVWILEIPCSEQDLSTLIDEGVSHVIEHAYNAYKCGLIDKPVDAMKTNPKFDADLVKEACAKSEAPTVQC